jgi:hypothetical protein
MATVDAQVLSHNGIDYIMSSTPEQIAIAALAAKKAVTIGTANFAGEPGPYGFYANHAYAIIGYNATTDKFILYNPWGTDQPSQVTWSQLQSVTTQMCVCDTSGLTPISSVPPPTTSPKISFALAAEIGGTVTVNGSSLSGTATASFVANSGNFQTPALAALVQSLDADGSISRDDMIKILRSVSAAGAVTGAELSDLKELVSLSTAYGMPDYVQVLASDVVNGNPANATYQGQKLGNLAAGSSAAQLNNLIDKWFLGTDHPALSNLSDEPLEYRKVDGSLFPRTPSHRDELQGEPNDCYLIAALGSLADSNPLAVENMFIDNGDGTYTVRFYTGTYGDAGYYSDGGVSAGFADTNVTADYVTVDSMLPTYSNGVLACAGYGASYDNLANSLWIPLAEKAYAQWNQTGKAGPDRDGGNAYASLKGGWMAAVDAQVLGHNAIDYRSLATTPEQVAIDALAAKNAVTINTLDSLPNPGPYGLSGKHAYAIIGYDAATDKFTLYNPWGKDHPSQVTWSQLEATCGWMCVCDASGFAPIGGAAFPRSSLSRTADIAGLFSSESADEAAAQTGAAAKPSAATNASHKVFATLDYHAVVQRQRHHIASPADRAGRASLVDATLLADDLWLQDETLAALV